VINNAYAKLLPKESQLPMAAPQFLCQYSNISECLPIEGQNQVNIICIITNEPLSMILLNLEYLKYKMHHFSVKED